MPEQPKLKLANQQNNLRYIYNTRRFLVWAVFFGFLAVVLLFVSLVPQINSISGLYSDLIKENKRLAQLRIKVAQLNDSTDSLVVTNADKINQALPSKKPLLELLTALGNVGTTARVSFNDISLTPGKISTESAETTRDSKSRTGTAQNKYESLNLDVTVTGNISNVNQFLVEIEKIAPFTTVTALTLNEKSTDNLSGNFSQAVFEAKITVTSYFFTRSVSANVDAQLPELTVNQREIVDALQEFTYTDAQQQEEIRGGGLENLFPGIGALPQ